MSVVLGPGAFHAHCLRLVDYHFQNADLNSAIEFKVPSSIAESVKKTI
jgi:hypothetical protein